MNTKENNYIQSKFYEIDTKRTYRQVNQENGDIFYNIKINKKQSISLPAYEFNLKDKTFRIKLTDTEGNERVFKIYDYEEKSTNDIKVSDLIKLLRTFKEVKQPSWEELPEEERFEKLFG